MYGVDDPAVHEAVRTYVKLLRAQKSVVARVEPLVASYGLTLTQFGVLEALLHKGSLTHRELCQKVLTSAGNITDVVDKLEHRGLVCRSRNAADRRNVYVSLTEQGRELIKKVFPRHAKDIAQAFAALSASEQRELGALLRKLGRSSANAEAPLEKVLSEPK